MEKDSSEDDIKRAYKKLALKLHPDKNTAPRSDEAFKGRIIRSHEALCLPNLSELRQTPSMTLGSGVLLAFYFSMIAFPVKL